MANSNTVKALSLPARVDDEAAITLKSTLIKLINDGARKIICNFSATEFLSADGAEELAHIAQFLRKIGGELGICRITPAVQSSLQQQHLFKFYSLEESIALVALRNLATYFEHYDDILDLKVRLENSQPYIEIYLGFDANQTMHQVQQSVNLIRTSLEQELADAQVLIIPSTQLEATEPVLPIEQKRQIVFSNQSPKVEQLAQAIQHTLSEDIPCIKISETAADTSFDLISVVFLIDHAAVDEETTHYLKKLRNQKVALFAVIENYPYSGYAGEGMKNIVALLDSSNTITGRFACQSNDNKISATDLMRARNKYFDIIHGNS